MRVVPPEYGLKPPLRGQVLEKHPDIDNDVVYNEAKTFINRVFGNGLLPMT